MKAKVWFHGLGQKHLANGVFYASETLDRWPKWAMLAYSKGYYSAIRWQ